jgi:TonB family protein
MKKIVYVLAITLSVAAWSCGSKQKENKDVTAQADSVAKAEQMKTEQAAAKKDKLAKSKAEIEAKRMADYEEAGKKTPTYKDASGRVIYYNAGTKPTYTGGNEAMAEYLNKNLVYPQQAKDDGLEGTIYVDFVVGKDGKVSDVTTTDYVAGDLDQTLKDEAVRVVSAMPAWTAGRQNGKPVDVKYTVPITFQLTSY